MLHNFKNLLISMPNDVVDGIEKIAWEDQDSISIGFVYHDTKENISSYCEILFIDGEIDRIETMSYWSTDKDDNFHKDGVLYGPMVRHIVDLSCYVDNWWNFRV